MDLTIIYAIQLFADFRQAYEENRINKINKSTAERYGQVWKHCVYIRSR